ncbi:MAG: 23S rRNA (uracil(1939)-C(5))-methyltransferase RlmD [Burkholderiales bacterium]|nr:23S rRNA (uracil(1939)-C(5))-methyltransferase RlmD [Burkholderiales bacterium]
MTVIVESLDQEGRGVARELDQAGGQAGGKVVFIEGALPGEIVSYIPLRNKKNFALARLDRTYKTSGARVDPSCPSFGVCGGCSLQHLEPRAQVAVKQRILEETLWHIGKIKAETLLPPIYGPSWGYRQRARFSVRYVARKGRALVGFHEKNSRYIADMTSCPVLPRRASELLAPLQALVTALSIKSRVPQIELSIGEENLVLVMRILEALTADDESLIRRFAELHGVVVFLQPRGPGSAFQFHPAQAVTLEYRLPEFDLRMPFHPTDFTQVNHAINRVLVRRAVSLLAPAEGDSIADLFCGLGNFTLAIARRGANVIGIDCSEALVRRARENAAYNALAQKARFLQADLFAISAIKLATELAGFGRFDKLLMDPPRDGAVAVVKALGEEMELPRRIVYVSCNPATLARDAALLTQVKRYRLTTAGVINMFPHTSHVESIALFELARGVSQMVEANG